MKKSGLIKSICFFILALTSTVFSKTVSGDEPFVVSGLLYSDLKPVSIEIKEGRIHRITRPENPDSGTPVVYIAPGFFDNQVNGFAGVSFTFGGTDLTAEGIQKATRELWKEGITSYLPTLTTNGTDVLMKNLAVLSKAVDDPALLGSVPGFHLEGPFISPVDGYRGAHPKQHVRLPDWNEFEQLYRASGNKILEITLAPEVEGAMGFIEKCTKLGVVVALGHHNADRAQVDQAVMNGARISTHLGNGCANMINRHFNPLWPQLANDGLTATLICDGFHLQPEEVLVFFKVKGPDKTILTSDVTHFAAMPPGKYTTAEGEIVELTEEGMLKLLSQNVLYGSASPLTRGIGNVMKFTGCSLSEAVRMASTNPARMYNLHDRGTLEPGKRADLVVFTMDGTTLKIQKTIVKGKTVYEKAN